MPVIKELSSGKGQSVVEVVPCCGPTLSVQKSSLDALKQAGKTDAELADAAKDLVGATTYQTFIYIYSYSPLEVGTLVADLGVKVPEKWSERPVEKSPRELWIERGWIKKEVKPRGKLV